MTWVPRTDLRRGWARRSRRAALAAGVIAAAATALRRGSSPDAAAQVDERPTARAASAAPAWCGTPRRTDDRAHAAFPGLPTIKLVYAYPAGRPNRINHFAPILQANAAVLTRYMAERVGAAQDDPLRPGHLVRAAVRRHPGRAASSGAPGHYRGEDGLPTVEEGSPLQRELRAATRDQRRGKKFLVYADGLNHTAPGKLDVTGDDRRAAPGRPAHPRATRRTAAGSSPSCSAPTAACRRSSSRASRRGCSSTSCSTPSAPCRRARPTPPPAGTASTAATSCVTATGSARSALYTDRACDEGKRRDPRAARLLGRRLLQPGAGAGQLPGVTHWNVYDSVYLARLRRSRA